MGRFIWLARQVGKQIAFRATLISLLSVILALLASALAPLIPYDLSLKIGAEAVDNILTILASSMLVVATFSVTAMVTAFNAAAQNVTPRATRLLIEDSAAQNALSTFLGGFLFGIVGIIALSTGYYGPEARAILYIGTVLMIIWIVVVLLRWIQRLTRFGRMQDTIERVEQAALEAVDRHKGPIVLTNARDHDATVSEEVRCERIGYVTHIDVAAIEEAWAGQVRICAPPGTFVDPTMPLVRIDGPVSSECRRAIVDAFTIGPAREFRNDPRFGVIVLAEIASRALSPAVNDPGSAMAVLDAGLRIFHKLVVERSEDGREETRVGWPLVLGEMVEDLIRPIARDGAKMAEVGIRLQRILGAVAAEAPPVREAADGLSRDAVGQARSSGTAPADLERVERARRRAFHTN